VAEPPALPRWVHESTKIKTPHKIVSNTVVGGLWTKLGLLSGAGASSLVGHRFSGCGTERPPGDPDRDLKI
jgi:hypothetical protein